MIINRKAKSAIVEDVMNFKKADEKLVETVEETKQEELVEAVNVKPSEVLLSVELEKPEKHEGLIECANRKELAEKITELKEKKIKHKVSKQDGKYVIECFESTKKEEVKSIKESWKGEDIIDGLIETAKDLVEGGDSPEDAVIGAIDQQLIYTSDIIALLEHYGSIDDSTIIESYYDELFSDVLNGLDVEESLKEEFTEKGKKIIKDARKAGLFDFYEPFAGNFTFTTQDYKANEDRVKAFLDSHEDYAVIRDSVKSYPGNEYIESSEDGFVYFVTNWGLGADEIGSAEIIVPSKHKEEPVKDKEEVEIVTGDTEVTSGELKQEESIKEDKKELDLKTAIKVADDTVLDDTFGKDTAERKLAQEIKDDRSENLEEAKHTSTVDKIKSKVLHYLDKLGYSEKDFEEYFVIEENEFVNDEGDKATHIQIRNDLVDYFEAEADGLISELDDLVAPGYFEPYDAYVWDAYKWQDLEEDLSNVSLDDANIDESLIDEPEIKVEEPEIEVDDVDVNFSVEEVKDIVDDVIDAVGEEMATTTDAENVDIEEIKDEVISDAIELKIDELDDDVSSFEEVEIVDTPDLDLDIVDEEPIVEEVKEEKIEESKEEETTTEKLEEAISSDEDMSEEDAKFFENLNISNNYKNEFKSEEQQKLDEELDDVVIKDDLGVEEDMSEEDMKAMLGE